MTHHHHSLRTIVAFDPGMVNHGFSVVQTRRLGEKREFRVVRAGKIRNCVQEYADWAYHLLRFKKEVLSIFRRDPPDLICLERFILRQRIPKGVTVEMINSMIGIIGLLAAEKRIPIAPFSAVVWKNAVQRAGYDLNKTYRQSRAEAHLIDAALLATYGAYWYFGEDDEDYFDFNVPRLVSACENMSEVPLLNRRVKPTRV